MFEFDDLTLMPFGRWRGTPLQDVPTSYFHWWWHNCRPANNEVGKRLEAYIIKSIEALKQEKPDLIWTLK